MPRLRALAADGFRRALDPVLPAVTCSVQATLLTGLEPRDHGIVGNGWYFRDLGEVCLWRQSQRARAGREAVGDGAPRASPGFTVRQPLLVVRDGRLDRRDGHAAADLPRRRAQGARLLHAAAGAARRAARRSSARSRSSPSGARPPGIASSRWIAGAARARARRRRARPDCSSTCRTSTTTSSASARTIRASARPLRDVDDVVGELVDARAARAAPTVVVLSEYGIDRRVDAPVHVNRALREAGLLDGRRRRPAGRCSTRAPSRAFAVADHQIAHVYVRDAARPARACASCSRGLPGVDARPRRRRASAPPASTTRAPASSSLVAEPDAWFTYYYWLDDDARARLRAHASTSTASPATTRPSSSSTRPTGSPRPRPRAALARKKARLPLRRWTSSRSTRRSCAAATAACPTTPDDGPVLLCSDPALARDRIAATDVRDLLLELAGAAAGGGGRAPSSAARELSAASCARWSGPRRCQRSDSIRSEHRDRARTARSARPRTGAR